MSAEQNPGDHDEAPQTYDGDLELSPNRSVETVRVRVHLSGFFQPIDGSFHWHGRTDPDPEVSALAEHVARNEIAARVPGGEWSPARLGEQNPWGGFRIAGRGRPPFEVDSVEVTH